MSRKQAYRFQLRPPIAHVNKRTLVVVDGVYLQIDPQRKGPTAVLVVVVVGDAQVSPLFVSLSAAAQARRPARARTYMKSKKQSGNSLAAS